MDVQSKITATCREYVHPWTESCTDATAGMLLAAIEPCLRTYVSFYVFTLASRMRIPTLKDLKKMLQGILCSVAFLVTNGYAFSMWICLLRQYFGQFYFLTVSFWPAFLASLMAIAIERPSRRPALALYVAYLGTESLWKMLETRGLVHSITNSQVVIFGFAITTLLYLYRRGLHKTILKDPAFKGISFVLGKTEEGPIEQQTPEANNFQIHPVNFTTITGVVQIYNNLIKFKHATCAHQKSCVIYAILGGLRPFIGCVSIQIGLKLLINIINIVKLRMEWRKQIFNRSTLQFGIFLGGFSFFYKAVSCSLRHIFGRDDPLFAIPAGLIGSLAFTKFPNTPMALYILWKSLHLLCNWGISSGLLPEIPNFVMYFYAFFTAVLFHAAILEANSLSPSYFKFLQNISGERLSRFNIKPFDVFGLNSYQQHKNIYTKLKIDMSSILPNIPLVG